MATIVDRLTKLVDDNVSIEGRNVGDPMELDKNITDLGITSADVVALWRLVNEEFSAEISREEFTELLTPRALVAHLEGLAA